MMPLNCENVAPFKKIENFCESFLISSHHIISAWMKIEALDGAVVNSIILNKLSLCDVINLHATIFLGNRHQIASVMPAQLISKAFLVLEGVD